ncbi:MAG: M20/M25/M40 family metallo-hydrolase [Clostridia bacterium]|nr:M20/M25/M40 family metallo-hydrolase [Clostridia bacterium]
MKNTTKAVLCAGSAAVAAGLGVNIAKAVKLKPAKKDAVEIPAEHVDLERYKKNLSDAIRIPTVSDRDHDKVDWAQFEKFRAFLEERYPLFHKAFSKEVVSDASLLYYMPGSDPSLDPIAMIAHQDVVPITPGTEQDWKYDPFGGVEAEGCIWGRGAIDMKNHLIAVMESIETLLEEGWQPVRGVYVLLGHNEENMMHHESGAAYISRELEARGVHLEALMDEGGAVLEARVKGLLDVNVIGVGIAEKGQADIEITLKGKGGHSSQPPMHNALGRMADVIKDLEDHQFKSEFTPLLEELFMRPAVKGTLPVRMVAANLKALRPALTFALSKIPLAAGIVRTTTAVTMAQGSPAPNVLPQKASINVNFRMMPGTSTKDVIDHIRKVVKNKDIELRVVKTKEPSRVSPIDTKAFHMIEEIYSANPKNVVIPYLVFGGTDSYLYEPVCENIYKYSPFRLSVELLANTHGTNERIPIDCMEEAVAFFKRYVRGMTASSE